MATRFICNILPSRETERDYDLRNATEAGYLPARPKQPESVDLRASWWKIADQQATGSCVGWALADGLLRWHFVQGKQLRPNELLSARFIWMSAKEVDELTDRPTSFIDAAGTTLKSALDIARKYGCVTAATLPFAPRRPQRISENSFYARAARYRIRSYYNLGRHQPARPQQWRTWLASGRGPLLARLVVDRPFDNLYHTKGYLEKFEPPAEECGHAVVIVGYRPGHFIIRNSWGRSWGDKGFAYCTEGYLQEALTEAYGVVI